MDTPSPSTAPPFPLSSAFHLERFCRLCMDSRQSGKLQRFYRDGEPVNPDLLEGIRTLVNVEIVLPDDQYSGICPRCLRCLEDYFIFRKHCQLVDQGVRELRTKRSFAVPPPPPERHADECQVVESTPSVVHPQDTLGIFASMDFFQHPSDGPDEYRMMLQGFDYWPLNLFSWICMRCGCRLDIDKDLSGYRVSAEHGHEPEEQNERGFHKINPAVRAFLDTLLIESYKQEQGTGNDPEQILPFPNVEEDGCPSQPEVTFFNCMERGLSVVHRGYHYLLSQVRFEGGSSMWQCSMRQSGCKVILETNSQLTTFKLLSEHSHAPPSPSVLDEASGTPISQDRAIALLAACPANEGQTAQPEVTFYRPAKSVIGAWHDGFCFRQDGFLAGGTSRWSCTWRGCSAKLELIRTLHCRLVPAGESSHGHPRPDEPVCSVANTMSPVKALVQLRGGRSMMEPQQQQKDQSMIVERMPQLQLNLTKVASETLKGFLFLDV